MQRKYILKIDEISTYDIKIENIEEMKNSIFIDAYKEAYRNLNSIIEAQNQKKKNKDKFIDKSINNIIAFIGERGSGKTSCMKSFLRAIENNEYLESEMENRIKVNFEILDMIEPSFFTDKINIIELVISNLFKKFSEELEKKELEDYEKKKKLLNEFQEIFKALKYMGCKEEYQNSEIEELLMLSTTVSFKERLQGLIKKYLEFIEKDKLVISVDDIDFNMNHAYEMVEGIRKYLTLDDVVIVINLKIEQLFRAIQERYSKEISALINLDKNFEWKEELEDRTEKYLLKLLPIERRIYLKNIDEYECNLVLDEDKKVTYKNKIIQLINEKTKFYLKEDGIIIKNLLSNNLRELLGIIVLIKKINNLNNLKEYIVNSYIKYNFKASEQNKILGLIKQPLREKNQYLLENILLNKEDFGTKADESEKDNFYYIVKRIVENNNKNKILKIIPMLYSIFFHEFLSNENKEGEVLEVLFGKYYLQNFKNFDYGNIKNIDEEIYKKIEIFIYDIKNLKDGNAERVAQISILAPFYKLLVKDPEKYNGLLFKDFDILYEFLLFLEIENSKWKVNNNETLYNEFNKFYKRLEEGFIRNLPNELKQDFVDSTNKLKEEIEKIKDIRLEVFSEENSNI